MSGSEKQQGRRMRHSSGDVPAWDVEEDHLLSYFLGGDAALSQGSNHNHQSNFVTGNNNNNYGRPSRSERIQPPTPAVQFYGRSSSSSAVPEKQPSSSAATVNARGTPMPTNISSSSASSLTSLKATLISGGPLAQQIYGPSSAFLKKTNGGVSNSSLKNNNISPISPAAKIGVGNEQMMLPPPPGRMLNYTPQILEIAPRQQPPSDSESKHRHLEWLQQINSIAKSSTTMGHAGPAQPQKAGSMPGFHPSHISSQHGIIPHTNQAPVVPLAASPFDSSASIGQLPSSAPPTTTSPSSNAESEERRARRLARNRESARQSRRRKKENLARLAEKVNQLHADIDTERKRQLVHLEPKMKEVREAEISRISQAIQDENKMTDENIRGALHSILINTDPDSPVRRATASFQYNTLKHLLIPRYQELLLWLTLHPQKFFTAGKEERAKVASTQTLTKGCAMRASSKQLGEEITNNWKSKEQSQIDVDGGGALTCQGLDAPRMWPLLCYELSISVDQEERLLLAQKKVRDFPNLAEDRRQMAVASRMSTNMKNGMLYQSHTVAHKSESALLCILSPEQTVKYLEWFKANRERCERVLKKRQVKVINKEESSFSSDGKENSLKEICEKLDAVLRIQESITKPAAPPY